MVAVAVEAQTKELLIDFPTVRIPARSGNGSLETGDLRRCSIWCWCSLIRGAFAGLANHVNMDTLQSGQSFGSRMDSSERPVMKLQLSAILLTSTFISAAAFGADDTRPQKPSVVTPAAQAVTVQTLGESVRAVNTAPPQAVNEVVKMSEAGVEEKTILSYVATAPAVVLKADDIIYLHEHGISTAVISAMLQHAPQFQAAQAPAPAPAQQQAPATAYYPAPVAQPVYVPTPEVVYTAPYPYYDYYYPYYPSIVVGGSFGFGRPYFHHNFYGGFRHFPTYRAGFHTGFGGGGFHTVSHGGFHGGFRGGMHR